MTTSLYIAPAATGKTRYLIDQVCQTATDLTIPVRVCVSNVLQAQSWRQRLAECGGTMGVRIQLFHELYMECLDHVGQPYTELTEPVQYRLLQALINNLSLNHYQSLQNSPGFIHLLQNLLGELKAARVDPQDLTTALNDMGGEARLTELADIYTAYQSRLQQQDWTDRAGLGWLAVEALAPNPISLFAGSHLFVDGFDNFTPVQIDFLQVLNRQVAEMVVTLTGTNNGTSRSLVHHRFNQTRQQLETALAVTAEPLPADPILLNPTIFHLEDRLLEPSQESIPGGDVLTLIEAPDRVAEVRSALRWLKTRLVQDNLHPGQVALLARSITPYRPFITQIGAEFGLPLRLVDGQPLRSNPAVAALLDLLRLMLPTSGIRPEPALPYRLVLEAWRSPYFDWSALPDSEAKIPIGIQPGDANLLERVAQYGRVIGGYRQWLEVFESITKEEKVAKNAGMADTVEAAALAAKFERFMQRLTPPETADHYRDFVRWLEDLIGADAQVSQRYPQVDPTAAVSLNIIDRVGAVAATAQRDLSALQSLKEVLRGLVWAEQAIAADEVISFAQFFADLVGAIEATSYTSSVEAADKSILVANVVQARGLSFQAVAVLGLAEGEFPANLSEDPLLWNADRRQLQSRGLRLNLPTDSAEVEFFYETITRPWGQLLLTRPRLADNGAPWKESPFWEEVTTLVNVEPVTLTHDNAPSPDQVASWPELMESLTTHPGSQPVWDWVKQSNPGREVALNVASQILDIRHSRTTDSLFDGSLAQLAQQFQQQFAPDKIWSASRLENYRTCPFMFFTGSVLRLEAKEEPSEGLDARQLGNIYHLILEKVYQIVADPNNLADLLEKLPTVAEPILDDAPHKEGFRETAWWAHTRQEIVANIRTSLIQLTEHADNFTPVGYEQRFFEPDHHLTVQDGDDTFQLHGYIDRVDRATDGSIRIIDYKTGGPAAFTNRAVQTGKKLQLALYALAARDALQLGQPVDGFYWHVQHAEPSPVTLRKFKTETNSGPEAAIRIAVEKAWEAVRGARAGHFVPQPPDEGCPSYCPAATFCWHYQPGFGG